MRRKNARLSLILALIMVPSVSAAILHNHGNAYADGMSFESLPSFLVEGRPVSLFIQVDPPVLTANVSNPLLQLRPYDPTNNGTIPHVSYLVYATKGNVEMMDLRFHSHSDPLKLNIHPQAGPTAVLDGDQDTSGAWTAKGDQLSVQSPLMLEGGHTIFK